MRVATVPGTLSVPGFSGEEREKVVRIKSRVESLVWASADDHVAFTVEAVASMPEGRESRDFFMSFYLESDARKVAQEGQRRRPDLAWNVYIVPHNNLAVARAELRALGALK